MQANPSLIDSPHSPADTLLVSVIVRSMGRASLGAALDSISAQTHRPIEVLIVNARGAGHGPLPLRCADLPVVPVASASGAPLLRAQAANRGLAAARGALAMFLDDDDLLLPDHVTRLVAALQAHPNAPAAYADAELGHLDRAANEEAQSPPTWHAHHAFDSAFDALRLRFENYLPIHSVLFRPSAAAAAGIRFDESFDLFEDWDFWLQLATLGDFIHVAGVSARYVVSGEAQSDVFADTPAARTARERLYDKWRQRSSPKEHAALLQRLQTLHRQAAQAGAQLDLSRRSETGLQALVAARDAEIADTRLTLRNLQDVVAARDLEIADANAMLGNLRAVVRAREVEVADAHTMQANLQALVSAREIEVADAQTMQANLRALVSAREVEVADALTMQANLQATLRARDTDISNAATQTRALEQTIAARDKELADAAEQLHAVRTVVAAREQEVANAAAQLQALQTLVAARDHALADAAAHAGGLQALVLAREQEISNAASHAQALTDILAQRDAEIAAHAEQLRALVASLAQRDQALAAGNEDLARRREELALARADIDRIGAELQQARTELQTLHAESPWRALNRTLKGRKNAPR